MKTLIHLIGVGFFGGLGTLARYGVSHGAGLLLGPEYPWGTYFVNIAGCFLFGLASGLVAYGIVPEAWKVYVLTGFLGGFTTFSAFAYENHQFIDEKRFGHLAFHLLGQNFIGIIAVLAGVVIIAWFFRPQQ